MKAKRVLGLDSLRFILATWVLISHQGMPNIVSSIPEDSIPNLITIALWNNLVNGPSAVIVFFVISGFCIHYPYAVGEELAVIPFYVRRHLRIWVPMIFGTIIAHYLGLTVNLFHNSILWSLLAEELYYLFYPLLLLGFRKFRTHTVLLISYIPAIAVILTNPSAGDYPSFGPYMNWILGLPCWLLGSYLAEQYRTEQLHTPRAREVWSWRVITLLISIACSFLRFHTALKYPISLTFFALPVYFWLRREITYRREEKPWAALEALGLASYSIYLFHLQSLTLADLIRPDLSEIWVLRFGMALLFCFLFYFTVERPSYSLAKWAARAMMRTAPQATLNAKGIQP